MKILQIHNSYKIKGGEDSVARLELEMLKPNNQVDTLYLTNDNIKGVVSKLKAFFSCIYSVSSYRKVIEKIKETNPDVVHVHNYFPMISPSVFYACQKMGVPVVHTLHNFRSICPTALLMHKSKITEKSITQGPWWSLKQKVYRDSYLGTLCLILMIEIHKRIGTWSTKVDGFIALTDFAKNKYIEAGFPAEKIYVKPNFSSFKKHEKQVGQRYAVYVGRLSQEKGIDLMLKAWEKIDFPLHIYGDGELKDLILANTNPNIKFYGVVDNSEIASILSNASFMVMPSVWYEGFPMVIVEAMASGLPVICSNVGGMAEIVKDKITGLHFKLGHVDDLKAKVNLLTHSVSLCDRLGSNAEKIFFEKYTQNRNRQALESIYIDVIKLKEASNMNSKCNILKMSVDVTNKDKAVEDIYELVNLKQGGYVCVSNVHMCMEVYDSKEFESVVNNADIVLPDGRPLMWVQRLMGNANAQQVRGEDVMNALCEMAIKQNLRIGLYGGSSNEVLNKVASSLEGKFNGLNISYKFSPPFRSLEEDELVDIRSKIQNAGVDILFVGIGCPKQERWMAQNKEHLDAVMLGVGAAFDFICGEKKHAPKVLQKFGLEWLYRLCSEPKRLWKRYLKQNPRFVYYNIKKVFFNQNKVV